MTAFSDKMSGCAEEGKAVEVFYLFCCFVLLFYCKFSEDFGIVSCTIFLPMAEIWPG